MLERIIKFSIHNKLIVILFTLTIAGLGLYSVSKIPVGTVPDITNNQVQIITTSTNLSTQEIEQFITAPVEMEMANLPGVLEIRSISKFGISLVTVVFEESLGTYLPRQLIAEKIKSASEKIPEIYGTPEMGPISTGLGEIYQYILDIKPGYEDQYTPMNLRTIQDWIVKRRLTGLKGVVEVNSWGGYLKQYEIALDPILLRSLDISLIEVYDALEKNNNISGGSYIEKNKQSYFIRGDGQVKNLDDIKNIVIKTNSGIPVFIKDVATVHFGYANRFGAITANGKGETILGQVMMLKNANSKEVIKAVKERVEEIQHNLPEGVFINPILERGELIAKTSFTVAENLILGALIVFITVLLLLGNIRSALVISSIIPLALLFTISMMYIFGIDANLMSLGALDFGIIIDGAVIIVEYIVFKMNQKYDVIIISSNEEQSIISDDIAREGASKMMKSAMFGQVIILIVFIPILSLQGVEGKMFHPMALAFSFAIIGAMLMGLTWLPVASSLFLKPSDFKKKSISKWILDKVYKSYFPVIKWSCENKKIVLSAAAISLIVTLFLFTRMGGEFVPTLDEGDFVIQPALKTGTSLSETINMTTKMENILIKNFSDEVDQIVCRIGAAEVPTDPMSMEEIDMIIKLKPKKQWQKAKSKEGLANEFKESLSVIPGVEYEFTQPIEMRFNELITGVRSDIAIKIYGEDLDYINQKANEIKKLVTDIPGAGDVILEKTTGLPQIKVDYKRMQLAKYNVDVEMLNTYLSSAFGGNIAGVVFEGEKRFDMVMRLQNINRTDIKDIRNLMVTIPSGVQIPLSEFADISYTEGPAKISRDNTRRRVVVSVNVRNRDLQSVVEDIRTVIEQNVKLQPGNYIEYGGQFENLKNATNRLMIAVPVALLLIFIFLHFAFQSFKDALMIFTAIPLATVGGVFLLWLRGMPFSVSAGIGFIALFGIAVLNGIVLIEHLKELQKDSNLTMREVIIQGTRDRLRPVLLTAGAAAMGFLPMAISTGAGAEVQRPLATVVIGGLVTSTMLTMIALPLFFEIFYNVVGIKLFPFRLIRSKTLLILLLVIPTFPVFSQEEVGLEQLKHSAIENNKYLKVASIHVQQAEANIKTSFLIPKTNINYGLDENNIAENNHPLRVWGINQEFSFPTYYSARYKANTISSEIVQKQYDLEQNKVLKEVSGNYFECVLCKSNLNQYKEISELYANLLIQSERRLSLNDINKLEYLNIKSRNNEIAFKIKDLEIAYNNAYERLKLLTKFPDDFTVSAEVVLLKSEELDMANSLIGEITQLNNKYAESIVKVEQNQVLPDLSVAYFIGSNNYENSKNYQGYEFGISIPLFYKSYHNTIKSAKLAYSAQQMYSEHQMDEANQRITEYKNELLKYKMIIQQYEETEIALAREIKRIALESYKNKEIDFLRFAASMESAISIESAYNEALFNYNMTYLEIKYFTW